MGDFTAKTNLRVSDSYNIDTKIDNCLPLTGLVQAQGLNNSPVSASPLIAINTASNTMAGGASGSTCYDNQNNIANAVTYSMSIAGGSWTNCSLHQCAF